MPATIVCPNCRRPQVPREEGGRLTCPDCEATLPSGLCGSGSSAEPREPRSSSSALDLPASGQPRPSGSITLLRSGLREEKNQPAGWMEGLFSRRGKAAADKAPSPASRVEREPVEEPAGPRSSTRSTRIDSPLSEEAPSRPAPGPADRTDVLRRPRQEASSDPEGSPAGRVPIAGILAFSMVASISSVALLQGRGAWANSLFVVTVFLLGVSLLGILHRRQARRAFWQGFALFGMGYLTMAFAPWSPHPTGLELPTSHLLATIHAKVAGPAEGSRGLSPMSTTAPGVIEAVPGAKTGDLDGGPEKDAPMFVAGDLKQFQLVGHCLITLLAALLGSGISGWFYRSNPGLA